MAGDIYVTGSVISSNLPIYREKNEMTVIDTTLSNDHSASLFNVWVDLNEPTALKIIFSIPDISFGGLGSGFSLGNEIIFKCEGEQDNSNKLIDEQKFAINASQNASQIYLSYQLPQEAQGLCRLGIKLQMSSGGKAYINGMLLAVKKV